MELERQPVTVVFQEQAGFTEVYGGGHGWVVLDGMLLRPSGTTSSTVLVFMHPMGVMEHLPLPVALARSGVHALCIASRYAGNDSALIMEKVALDLGAAVRHCRERLGYSTVVLAGWSGGGSLSAFYQSQAESPTVTSTPAGEPPDLTAAGLPPADAVMQLAAHVSRAQTLTEWLDASVVDEVDPFGPGGRDPSLDLYDDANPEQPPYSAGFLERYRDAQLARNRRITAWVREQLADEAARARFGLERSFVVHGTMADPRWLDPTVDPNDRRPGWCYLGDPRVVNNSPAGLGRFSSLRAWLSQWSVEDSNADGPRHLARISVPVLVVENSADDACTPEHTQRIYGAVRSDKELHVVKGATHYYLREPKELAEAVEVCRGWLTRKGLLAA